MSTMKARGATAPGGLAAPPPFLILALPRSRTFWLSRWLSFGGWECGHEQLRFMRSVEDVKAWLGTPCFGSVETMAAPWWRLAMRMRPDLRLATIRRSPEAVMESLEALRGVVFQPDVMLCTLRRWDAKLDQVEARTGALRIRYAELDDPQVCKRLWAHCLGGDMPWVEEWFNAAQVANAQVDFPALIRYMQANAGALGRFAGMAKQQSLALLARQRRFTGAVALREERFADFRHEARDLVRKHMETVGLATGSEARDLTILDNLDAKGNLSTITARVGGEAVGYLVSVISAPVDLPGRLEATVLIIYGSPKVPGLGQKLLRFALENFRQGGLARALLRAGVTGSGPQLGPLFLSQGAEPFGQLFKIDLQKETS